MDGWYNYLFHSSRLCYYNFLYCCNSFFFISFPCHWLLPDPVLYLYGGLFACYSYCLLSISPLSLLFFFFPHHTYFFHLFFFFSVIGPELFLYLYGNLNLQFLRLVYIGMIPYSLLFFFILLFFLFVLYFPAVIPLTSLLYNSSFFLSSTCTHPCVTFPHPSLLH